jgi:putative tryptophan/tyrosine transport system substrate-binding protein
MAEATFAPRRSTFSQRLRELGWIEGQNLVIEYRLTEGPPESVREIAAEFVRMKVDVIVTSGDAQVRAAQQATAVIPIVFPATGDPVGNGIVASLARPGGNATGISALLADTAGKRVELLRELVPSLRRLAITGNSANPLVGLERDAALAAAHILGLDTITVGFRTAEDIAPAIESLKGLADALYVCLDPLVAINKARISSLALAARLPDMHFLRDNVEAGGLAAYGPAILDLYRRAAEIVDKILRGTKPADIPVEQPTKFDLVINLKTAKALGLAISETVFTRADEVIE